jgi:hypothetical protein
MTQDQAPASTDRNGEVVSLIAAVAAGDAGRQDVVATMRDKGIDCLDVLVEVLASAVRASHVKAPRFADPQALADPGPPRAADAVHPNPGVPFVLRGTMYDPDDITRFNDGTCT